MSPEDGGVPPRHGVNLSSSRSPSGQGPWPEAALIWPADSKITSSLPHASAKVLARSSVAKGSLVLATTIDLKGNRLCGQGANPVGPTGIVSASTSGGETKRAAATRLFALPVAAAQ